MAPRYRGHELCGPGGGLFCVCPAHFHCPPKYPPNKRAVCAAWRIFSLCSLTSRHAFCQATLLSPFLTARPLSVVCRLSNSSDKYVSIARCHSEFDTGSLRFVRVSPIPYVCLPRTTAATTTTFLTYVTYVTLRYVTLFFMCTLFSSHCFAFSAFCLVASRFTMRGIPEYTRGKCSAANSFMFLKSQPCIVLSSILFYFYRCNASHCHHSPYKKTLRKNQLVIMRLTTLLYFVGNLYFVHTKYTSFFLFLYYQLIMRTWIMKLFVLITLKYHFDVVF